ncbi:hypothetical protein H2198_009014 [Neophaeococcomyces mojaviensis]|uniref:Uncharacterized protein n=1 Tax=Neophaeococcomyces mojaviensis TaxID=3383035 RepID=A0ACC2ZVN2_9EURO|nr:hypothetical protein H2198_009014 [Knufia sp. JES_112]
MQYTRRLLIALATLGLVVLSLVFLRQRPASRVIEESGLAISKEDLERQYDYLYSENHVSNPNDIVIPDPNQAFKIAYGGSK